MVPRTRIWLWLVPYLLAGMGHYGLLRPPIHHGLPHILLMGRRSDREPRRGPGCHIRGLRVRRGYRSPILFPIQDLPALWRGAVMALGKEVIRRLGHSYSHPDTHPGAFF